MYNCDKLEYSIRFKQGQSNQALDNSKTCQFYQIQRFFNGLYFTDELYLDFIFDLPGDTDNPEGGAEGGAKEAEGGGEAQDGAAGRAVRADHCRDAPEAVGTYVYFLESVLRS